MGARSSAATSFWLDVDGAGINSHSVFREQDLEDLEDSEDCDAVDRFEFVEDGIVILRMRNSADRVTGTYNFRVSTR